MQFHTYALRDEFFFEALHLSDSPLGNLYAEKITTKILAFLQYNEMGNCRYSVIHNKQQVLPIQKHRNKLFLPEKKRNKAENKNEKTRLLQKPVETKK